MPSASPMSGLGRYGQQSFSPLNSGMYRPQIYQAPTINYKPASAYQAESARQAAFMQGLYGLLGNGWGAGVGGDNGDGTSGPGGAGIGGGVSAPGESA